MSETMSHADTQDDVPSPFYKYTNKYRRRSSCVDLKICRKLNFPSWPITLLNMACLKRTLETTLDVRSEYDEYRSYEERTRDAKGSRDEELERRKDYFRTCS